MYNIKRIQIKLIFTVVIAMLLVSCSGTPKDNTKLNSSSTSKTAPMKMGLIVLFKKNTSYLDISELNQKLPKHIHEVVKSKQLFKYSFESHENYMSCKKLLTASSIVEAVSIDQGN